jgi:glycosyltransferase involved in cell wall biosynthesis
MQQNISIGFYCSSLGWGGLEMNLLKRAKWWKELGSQVVVFCVDESPIYKKAKDELLRIERVNRNKKYGDRTNAKRVYQLCVKHKINVLWIRDSRDISIAGRIKKLSGNRIVVLYQQAMQLGVKKKDFIHTRRFSRIDIWISPLEFLAKQVREKTKFPPERIHVVPLGVEIQQLLGQTVEKSTARVRYNLDQNVTVLGIIGRIDPKKGQLFLVSALAELRKKYDDLHLLIVGEKTRGEADGYEEDVRKAVAKLGLKKVVHFKPFSEEVGSFYAACDIVVMASEAETFGMVTLEAMLFGCRIIGTNTGGTPELLSWGEFGELYSPDNIREFCQAFETMMVDEDRALEKARNARVHAKEMYEHHHECEELKHLLLDSLGKASNK